MQPGMALARTINHRKHAQTVQSGASWWLSNLSKAQLWEGIQCNRRMYLKCPARRASFVSGATGAFNLKKNLCLN